MSEACRILEHFTGESTAYRVDAEKCIIYGCCVLGDRSKNPPPDNNVYPTPTRQAACGLIEGIQVGVNHLRPQDAVATRPYEATNGFLREAKDDGVSRTRANWHLNPHHALTPQILWDAQHNPKNLGFSINGDGRRRRADNGDHVVEAIERLDTVDLVSRPATTNGLSEGQRRPVKKKLRELIESLKATRPGYARGLREAAESGLMSADREMDADCAGKGPGDPLSDAGQAADHEQALRDGFKAAVHAVIDDDGMDLKAKVAKVKEILSAQEKLLAGGKGGKGGGDDEQGYPDEDDTEAAREGRKGKRGNLVESLKLQIQVRDLCADEQVTPGKVLRKALDACATLQEARDLIAEHKKAAAPAPAPDLLTRGGAKSAGVTPQLLGIQESAKPAGGTNNGQQQNGLSFGDGDDAAAKRNNFLRGNGRR